MEAIHYTVIGFKMIEFNNEIYKAKFDVSCKEKLQEFFKDNKILKCFEDIDEIFEDLMLDNFIETYTKDLKKNHLNLNQVSRMSFLVANNSFIIYKKGEILYSTFR